MSTDTPARPAPADGRAAQESLAALDSERDALRDRIAEALIEHTLAEANGGRPKPNGRRLLDPVTLNLIEKNNAARAAAILPVIEEEATAIALRLTEGYEIGYRRDQAALMDADDREADLKARIAAQDAEITTLRAQLAATTNPGRAVDRLAADAQPTGGGR